MDRQTDRHTHTHTDARITILRSLSTVTHWPRLKCECSSRKVGFSAASVGLSVCLSVFPYDKVTISQKSDAARINKRDIEMLYHES